ncbi:preprotein translocase subunit SecE [Metamycoplasma subdolum]|uniref:Preprotein translocase subunit SecE n=1 Tax=Metamycoplasma subdolum TaxID=92407 RepID=A0A3L9ZZJ8_9BACT|nr:preprotein translocase subunit SecE [Metamycoplasma subdolum]RMA77564.1 preprotein translocase subunit SecE [Metamycoplasma subdolum]WPB50358.1 preprotein translocase subunit SecE [Metamycoplasma subdolum]
MDEIKEEKIEDKKESKPIKESTLKNFAKEVKRIKWPKSAKAWKWFGITIAFLVVMAIFCFLMTLLFSSVWNAIGIKS